MHLEAVRTLIITMKESKSYDPFQRMAQFDFGRQLQASLMACGRVKPMETRLSTYVVNLTHHPHYVHLAQECLLLFIAGCGF